MEKKSPDPRLGHRQRLRRRFLNAGLDALAEHEIVELLLSFAIPRRDVKPDARVLLEKYGSVAALLDTATPDELLRQPGLGESSATLILLVRELCIRSLERPLKRRDLISDPEDAVRYLRMKLGGGSKETLAVLYLNKGDYLIACDLYPGTVDHTLVYPNEIAEKALLRHASGVLLAHNHPSGMCTPSPADMDITMDVRQTLAAIHIKLCEHIIVTPTAHLCLLKQMRERNIFPAANLRQTRFMADVDEISHWGEPPESRNTLEQEDDRT